MTDASGPVISSAGVLDATYASVLAARKRDAFGDDGLIRQNGAVTLAMDGWAGWPSGLAADEPVIETFIGSATDVSPTSELEPFVGAWRPLVEWMNHTVRSQIAAAGLTIDGDAYITASLTAAAELEGMAHMDDDTYIPDDSVGLVAIIGQHEGPRIATTPLAHAGVRPMSQVVFDTATLDAFANNELDHCRCDADQLVAFSQFGQLHAGPAAHHLAGVHDRQLLVMRARLELPG